MTIDRSRVLSDHWAPSSTPRKVPSATSNKLQNEPRPISTTILRCHPDSGSPSNRAATEFAPFCPVGAMLVGGQLAITPPLQAAVAHSVHAMVQGRSGGRLR